MIIKASLGNGFSGVLLYVHKTERRLKANEKPIIIERNNLIGDNPKLLAYQMRMQAENSGYSKKPVLHLSFAFAPEDKLTQEMEIECIMKSMLHLGVSEEKHQYVLVKHNDSNNPHYHAVINKVSNYKSQILNTDWIRNKCIATADKMEQDYNLVKVENRNVKFEEISLTNPKGYRFLTQEERAWMQIRRTKENPYKYNRPKVLDQYRTLIQNGISYVLDNKLIIEKENFENELAKINIQSKINIDENTNKIKGISFKYNNETRVKGSDVGFSANVINQKIEINKGIERQKNFEQKPNTKDLTNIENKWNKLQKHYEIVKNQEKLKEESKKVESENNENEVEKLLSYKFKIK
jgi:Relaxase/Mobilisation nuclease domain